MLTLKYQWQHPCNAVDNLRDRDSIDQVHVHWAPNDRKPTDTLRDRDSIDQGHVHWAPND